MFEKATPYSISLFNMALSIRLKKNHMNKHRKDWSRLLPLISIKFDSGSAVAAQSGLI